MLRGAAAALLVAAVLASCSGGDDASPTTTVAASTTTAVATPTTTVAGPAVPPGPLAAALLTAADVGDGFFATPAAKDAPAETTPCGAPSIGVAVPPEVRDGVAIGKFLENLQLSQTVYRYPDEATAQQAVAAGEAGLVCGKGSSTLGDGSTTQFDLTKLNQAMGLGDQEVAYTGTVTAGGQTIRASFVVLRVGRAVTTITFLSSPQVQGPSADPILTIAAQKLATVV